MLAAVAIAPTFFGFAGGSCEAMLRTLGLSCPPPVPNIGHVDSNLRPAMPKSCQDPNWAKIVLKLEPVGPRSAQITPK